MIYYAFNSVEARGLLKQIHGQQSDILALHSCGCGDGHAISDPIDDSHRVVICQTCKPRKGNIVKLIDNLSEDGFAYDFCFGEIMPMPSEFKWVLGTTKHTTKESLKDDTAKYVMDNSEALAFDDKYLVVLVDGKDITLNIAEK